MKTKVAIVTLNWNSPQITVNAVDQILNIYHSLFNFQIILIDSHSTDDSVSIFKKKYSNNPLVKIIVTDDNYGTAEGNNYGIRYSLENNFTHTLIINNDVNIDSQFLDNLIKFQAVNNVDIASPKIYFAPGHEFHHNHYSKQDRGKVIWFVGGKFDWNNVNGFHPGVDEIDHGQFDQANYNVDFLTGCCVLINNRVFKKIGIFNPYYFMYLEDIDFCRRAKINGFCLAYCPNAHIWHINASSSGGVGSKLQDYFLTRNRLYFGFHFCTIRTKLALFRESLRMLFTSPSKWQKRGIIDFYLGVSGKGSWQ